MSRWAIAWVNGWMEGQTDGRTDGQTDIILKHDVQNVQTVRKQNTSIYFWKEASCVK